MNSGFILQALMQANISTVNQASSSSGNLVSNQTSIPLGHYLPNPSQSGLQQDVVPSLSTTSTIEPSHFLVLNPADIEFGVTNAPVIQDNIRYVNVTNNVFPVQPSTSSADQYINYTDCVQAVDPNIVMAVQSACKYSPYSFFCYIPEIINH